MLDIKGYESGEKILGFFEELSKIPHGSGNTGRIVDYLEDFAKARGLCYVRDGSDNIIIRKKATPGYENRPGVIFQGHTDMVAEKALGKDIDMENEGLTLIREGDILKADGTTLGADDGVAIAYALAVLDSDDIPHPDFEAVLTSDEEIGLIGAAALDPKAVKNRLLINIDSDMEGIFTVGCAGGMRSDISLPVKREDEETDLYKLTLAGFKGGHSGMEIDKGRINPLKLIGEILVHKNALLADIGGGSADNAIPREATAIFKADKATAEIIKRVANDAVSGVKEIEEGAYFELNQADFSARVLDSESTDRILSLICKVPSGVIAMSVDTPGMVETSLNLGIMKCDADSFNISFSVRSAKGKEKRALGDRLAAIAKEFGASYGERGDYPAWEYRKNSHLREVMVRVYERMYSKSPEIITIHAGLECGIFSEKMPEVDCVSIGPDSFDIHTPKERLSISSFVRVWEYLKQVLAEI